jgi:hypothetical protein
MRILKRLSLSLVVALLVAIGITSIAYAVYGYVSEQSADFTSSGLSAAPGCSGASCQDGNAKRGAQSLSFTTTTRWGNWYTATDNVDQWWTFIPNLTGDFAAVRYSIGNSAGEVYYTTVNQNNWKGSYVNLGTFGSNSTSAMMYLPNRCVTGYACDGRYLYFDKSRFAY